MRTIGPDLYDAIQEGSICRLIKMTTKTGTVYAWCDSDVQITVDGVTYIPEPGLQTLRLVTNSNTEVSAQEIGAGWVDVPEQDIRSGMLDSAEIEGAWASYEHPENGRLVTFIGKIDNITYTKEGFKAEIMSFMKQLERNIGFVYSANCRHKLFGSAGPGLSGACALSASSYTFTGTITSVIKNRWKFGMGLSQPAGYFSSGRITFTSGANSGLQFQVKTHETGTLELMLPAMRGFSVGDTFTVQAGCDKTFGTCKTKFNNAVNFGGFPHINPNVNYR